MIGREKTASEVARLHSREAELRRARFHNEDAVNATMQVAAFTRLALTSTPELVEQLEDAVAANNLALAEAVRLAFHGRTDRESVRDRFTAVFAKVKTPNADAVKTALGNVASLAGLAKERWNSAISGRSDPIGRLNAARLAAA